MADLVISSLGTVASVTNSYCTLAQLKEWLASPSAGSNYDAIGNRAIAAASDAIDNFCHRRFWLDSAVVARTFEADDYYDISIDDIGSTSGLIVKTDIDGDGTFETTWASDDYQLTPVNAANAFPEAKPWTGIRAVDTYTFPVITTGRLDRVQITAKWGWPAVPDSVTQACIIKAARLFHRRNSPQGVAAFDDFGPVRISRAEDGDVIGLLNPYVRMSL